MTKRRAYTDLDELSESVEGRVSHQVAPMTPVVFDPDKLVGSPEKQSAEDRRRKRAADLEESRVKKHLEKQEAKQRAEQLKVLGEEILASGVATREILPKLAQSIIVDLGLRLAGGEWEIKSAEEATKVAKIWYDILRLESGQATTIQENRSGSPEDRLSRLEELKIEAKRRVEAGLRAIGDGA